MGVDVGCGGNVAVSQPLLNLLQAYTIGIQKTRAAMPKLVEAENRVLLVVAESRIC